MRKDYLTRLNKRSAIARPMHHLLYEPMPNLDDIDAPRFFLLPRVAVKSAGYIISISQSWATLWALWRNIC